MKIRQSRRLVAFIAVGVFGAANAATAKETQYTYDALGRVLSAIDEDGKTVSYSYDNAGNRTRLSNGQEYQEYTSVTFTASSNAGTTGLATAGAMRDGTYTTAASIHATNVEAGAWIKADLGALQTVNHIVIAPAVLSAVGAGVDDFNGAVVEFSVDNTAWTRVALVSAGTVGQGRSIALGGVKARYVRIRRLETGQVALGDFRLFSAASAGSALVAEPDAIANNGASSLTFDPRTNDRSASGGAFAITSVEDPPHGQAVLNGGTSITYIPDVGYAGGDVFSYAIGDVDNNFSTAQITATVTPQGLANRTPVAVVDQVTVGDRITAAVDGVTTIWPLLNDYDADRDVLSITATSAPSHGQIVSFDSRSVRYSPTVGYAGADSFTYTISDGRGGTASATVNLTVANSPPVARADTLTTYVGTSVVFDPRVNDLDPNGDSLTVTSVSNPTNGAARVSQGQTTTFTPNAGYIGSDTFTYTVSDGRGGSSVASVVVSVAPPPATVLSIIQPALYAPSTLLEGATFTVASPGGQNVYVDQPINDGKVYWEAKLICGGLDAGVTNKPSTAYNYGGYSYSNGKNAGIDTNSRYWWTTSQTASGFAASAVGDVFGFALDATAKTLQIRRNNVAGPTISLPFGPPYYPHSGVYPGVTLSGQTCASGTSKGQLLFGSGATTYTPPSGFSHLSAAPANTPPVATPDEYTVTSGAWIVFDPKSNDLDANGDAISLTALGTPSHGTLTSVSAGVRYNPTAGYTGTDTFTYSISDPQGGVATGMVTLNVIAGARTFAISPPVSGKSTWNLDTDGPLDLATGGNWTITPANTFAATFYAWGGGGGGSGGGGGFAGGSVLLEKQQTYKFYVGGAGSTVAWSSGVGGVNGGGNGGYAGGGGGGYSGIRAIEGNPIVISGGGGGGSGGAAGSRRGGAGGGSSGQTAPSNSGTDGGVGGGQTGSVSYAYKGENGSSSSGSGTGGGGGGFFGGRAGSGDGDTGELFGGGGGSGFLDAIRTTLATLLTGSLGTPANSGEAKRVGAGDPSTDGRLRIE